MSNFRYHLKGKWYKGNSHTHSSVSDGRKEISELGSLYRQAGYDFLCLTDHWVASGIKEAISDEGLLWINGIELHGKDTQGSMFHFVALGDFLPFDKHISLEESLKLVRQQGGFLILAHPFWMGLNLEESHRHAVDAVEIYNHICWRENGKGDGLVYWHHLLQNNRNMLGIASDDAHFIYEPPAWRGGWLMVNADQCTRPAIFEALRAGRFYASCGPDFTRISMLHNVVYVETSPVRIIRLVGPGSHGKAEEANENQTLTSASFEIPDDWAYSYLEIEDGRHRRAWTNTLFF